MRHSDDAGHVIVDDQEHQGQGTADRLQTAMWSSQLKDLTHFSPPTRRGAQARKASFDSLELSREALRGREVAFLRGRRFLLEAYRRELRCHFKRAAVASDAVHGQVGDVQIDVDNERKYEHLPLSPTLLKRIGAIGDLTKRTILEDLWDHLEGLESRTIVHAQSQDESVVHHEDI